MMIHAEAGSICESGQDTIEVHFQLVRHSYIGNGATRGAHEMVVMSGEMLPQFKTHPLINPCHPHHDACFFEHGEIPIHRRLRKVLCRSEDLWDREWTGCVCEHRDKSTARGREPLARFGQLNSHIVDDSGAIRVAVCV